MISIVLDYTRTFRLMPFNFRLKLYEQMMIHLMSEYTFCIYIFIALVIWCSLTRSRAFSNSSIPHRMDLTARMALTVPMDLMDHMARGDPTAHNSRPRRLSRFPSGSRSAKLYRGPSSVFKIYSLCLYISSVIAWSLLSFITGRHSVSHCNVTL